jgi:hypothetical protein
MKGKRAVVGNYRPVSILNNFSKMFESVTHDHLSFYFSFKLYPNQHSFVELKSTESNLVTYLNDVLFVHEDSLTLFIFIIARPSVKFLILLKFGLSSFYIKWFQSYI